MKKTLTEILDYHEIEFNKITRLIDDMKVLKKTIKDVEYLKLHAGEMIFTGNSGQIDGRDVMLKTVKINTLGGCVEIPNLLIKLSERRLKEVENTLAELMDKFNKG